VSGSGKGGAGVFCASGPAGTSGPNWSGCSTYSNGAYCRNSQDYGRKGQGVPADGTYSGSCKAVAAGAASWAKVKSPISKMYAYCQSAISNLPGGKDSGGNGVGSYFNTLAKAQTTCAALGPACGGVEIRGQIGNACSKTSGGYYWSLCKAQGSQVYSFTTSTWYCAWQKSGVYKEVFTLKKQ